ncbi:MAG: right-handed parallel beta-helix repeat-containing protein [Planctomycetota bacterium]
MIRTTARRAGAVAALAITAAATAQLGPLTPPGGAVSNTGPHLGQIEPRIPVGPETTPGDADSIFRINKPGSYYLTSNLSAQPGREVVVFVEIDAENVTLDLNGFTIDGNNLVTRGIEAYPDHVRIFNGRVRETTGDAIDARGNQMTLQDLEVMDVAGDGILVARRSIVERCRVTDSGGRGFLIGSGSSVRHSAAFRCGANGFDLLSGATAEACSASLNTGAGFELGDRASVRNAYALANGGDGFVAGSGGVIDQCTAQGNANGINAGQGVVITNNALINNLLNGIDADAGNHIEGNTCRLNDSNGILVRSSNTVLNNTVDANDATGIRILDEANRVDSNLVTSNDFHGIRTQFGSIDNFIVRNMLHQNTPGNMSVDVAGNFAPSTNTPNTTATFANIDRP